MDFDNCFSKSSCVLAACRAILLAASCAFSFVRPSSFKRLISFSTASALLFREMISSSVVAISLFISASSCSFRLIKSLMASPCPLMSSVLILYISINVFIAILFAERASLYRSVASRTLFSVLSSSLETSTYSLTTGRFPAIVVRVFVVFSLNIRYISCARSFNSGISLFNPARNSVK